MTFPILVLILPHLQVLVEKALTTVKTMISSQMSWAQMDQLRAEAAANGQFFFVLVLGEERRS